jgi:uncharacterized pyridoxamine 5'-phosphate oxidase family protein
VGAGRKINLYMDEQKKKVLEFIGSQGLGVISTVGADGKPEAAVIGVSEMDDLSLIFGTFNTYRKYKNLKSNSRVAVVIGWTDVTVQYEGVATELVGESKERAKQIHIKKSPHSVKFGDLPEQRFFKVTPTWIRYTDYSRDSIYGDIFELSFKKKS